MPSLSETLLPPVLRTKLFLAYEDVIRRLKSIDLKILDIHDIDNVTEEALYDLADQFNVLGLRGWELAPSITERRALVKEAIVLHQTAGTPFAVLRSLELVGYPSATIEENPGLRYDGSTTYNGSATYSGAFFGAFIVTLDPTQSAVSGDQINLIISLINEWKNKRSYLLDLRIGDISLFSNLLQYDGTASYDGQQEYDGVRNI